MKRNSPETLKSMVIKFDSKNKIFFAIKKYNYTIFLVIGIQLIMNSSNYVKEKIQQMKYIFISGESVFHLGGSFFYQYLAL